MKRKVIHNISNKWVDFLIKNGASLNKKEHMVYGIECLLYEIIVDIIIFAFAFIIGKPLEMLVWNVFMLPLRYSLGGHHMSSHIKCLISSSLWAILCVLIYPYILNWTWLLIAEIAITIIVAFKIAPFVHPNHPMTDAHKAKIKKAGRRIALIESIVIIATYFLLPSWVAQVSALGMFSATLLCIMGFLDLRAKKTSPAN